MWIYQGRREQKRLYFSFPFLRHSSRGSELGARQHQGLHPRPIFKNLSLLPPTGWSWAEEMGSALPTFSTPYMCIQPKKNKTTLRNDIFIKCSLNCWVQLCSTTETFSLPVRWVVLHENWLFQANSINTCHCFLMRQYPAIQCTSTGKPALLSLPVVMMLYPCLTTLVQTLGEAEIPFRTCCGVWGGVRDCVGETCRAAQLCKPQIPQSTVPVQCLAEGTVHSHPQSNAVLK